MSNIWSKEPQRTGRLCHHVCNSVNFDPVSLCSHAFGECLASALRPCYLFQRPAERPVVQLQRDRGQVPRHSGQSSMVHPGERFQRWRCEQLGMEAHHPFCRWIPLYWPMERQYLAGWRSARAGGWQHLWGMFQRWQTSRCWVLERSWWMCLSGPMAPGKSTWNGEVHQSCWCWHLWRSMAGGQTLRPRHWAMGRWMPLPWIFSEWLQARARLLPNAPRCFLQRELSSRPNAWRRGLQVSGWCFDLFSFQKTKSIQINHRHGMMTPNDFPFFPGVKDVKAQRPGFPMLVSIQDPSNLGRWLDMAICLGLAELPMKVSTSMVRNMAQGSTPGQMVVSMKGNGPMDRCMARAYFMLRMVQQLVALGVMARGLSKSFHKWADGQRLYISRWPCAEPPRPSPDAHCEACLGFCRGIPACSLGKKNHVLYLLLLHPGVHGVRPTLVGAAVWYLVVAVSVDVWVVQRRGRSAR